MKSIIYQANAPEKDHVPGCFGIIVMLQAQVERLKEEIEIVLTRPQQEERDHGRGFVHSQEIGRHDADVVPHLQRRRKGFGSPARSPPSARRCQQR
ncbi:hypothetical protein SUGI_1084120 [Cryptomeria japonica]|nr:hypothetical protein SUGI_1084120 [Cryptomeria japonica]